MTGRAQFNQELKGLQAELVEMGSYVESAINQAIKAFKTHDTALCKELLEGDRAVDEMEKKIESKCLWLIARQQPVASDLRKITTALKIITDMERIGDHATDIAELVMRIGEKNAFADSIHILQMASVAVDMVHNAVIAYVKTDLALAKVTAEKDDIVDDYFNQVKQEIARIFHDQPQHIDNAIDFLLIAKYLERIADHAVNICEWVQFSQTGKHKDTLIF